MKTSVTLSEDLLRDLDKLEPDVQSRSELVEKALRLLRDTHLRGRREARDRRILDQRADQLNEEAEDVLAYQEEP